MQRHCAVDAALVNNGKEMSGTDYNMQQYTNVFMSPVSVGGCFMQKNSGSPPNSNDRNTFSFFFFVVVPLDGHYETKHQRTDSSLVD